jgi:WD40 repeat protein
VLCVVNLIVTNRCRAGASSDLLDDYTRTRAALGTRPRRTMSYVKTTTTSHQNDAGEQLREMQTWLRASLHIVSHEPELTFQLAANTPRLSTPHRAAALRWSKAVERNDNDDDDENDDADGKRATKDKHTARLSTWLRWLNAPQAEPPLRGSLPLPTSALAIAVTRNASSSSSSSSYSLSRPGDDDALSLPAGGGAVIAVALRDNSVRLYAGDSGAELAVLTGHSDWVVALAFSPDGSTLATASWDTSAKVFDVQLGACEATVSGHRRRCSGVRYTNDGRLLATSGMDCCVHLWDTRERFPFKTYDAPCPVSDLAFSPDDQKVH